jgi:hypothetical protein
MRRENGEEKKSYISGAGSWDIYLRPASSDPGRVSRTERNSYKQQKNLVP